MTSEFLLTAFVIIASPGSGALYTIAAGLSGGTRASLVAAFGCTLGTLPHMLAAISGLAALLHTSTLAFDMLRYLGVAYLLYMAFTMFRDRGMQMPRPEATHRSARQVITSAILINLLNPKLSMFFFAFLPQFVRTEDTSPALLQMLGLSLVFMALTLVIFALYGTLAATARQHVASSVVVQTWMRRGFAVAFAGLALQLALARR